LARGAARDRPSQEKRRVIGGKNRKNAKADGNSTRIARYSGHGRRPPTADRGPARFIRLREGRYGMDEFGGGFLRSVMICFFLALAVSFVFVWFPDLFRP
jgi:hypothetical protein